MARRPFSSGNAHERRPRTRLQRKTPALILVDFVEAYFAKDSPLYAGVEDALASALRIRKAARAAGIPVFYTNVVYHAGGTDGGIFFRKVPALEAFIAGNPLGEWPAGLEPADDEFVISKQYPSAFFNYRPDDQRVHPCDLHRYCLEWFHPDRCGGRLR
jgi:nicotinamidase-related amidase